MKISTLIEAKKLSDADLATIVGAINLFGDDREFTTIASAQTIGMFDATHAIAALRMGERQLHGVAKRRYAAALELLEDADADLYNDAMSAAEDSFWKTFVTYFPEIKTGDLNPRAASKFREAIHEVCGEWMLANNSKAIVDAVAHHAAVTETDHEEEFRRWRAGRSAFVSAMPTYNGWKLSTDLMTGSFMWSNGTGYHVWATPDHDVDGRVTFDFSDDDDGNNSAEDYGMEAEQDWPVQGRTHESYLALCKPYLDRWTIRTVVATYTIVGCTDSLLGEFRSTLVTIADESDMHPADVTLKNVEIK